MKYTKPTTQPQVLANALQAAENAHEAMDGSMGTAKSTAWTHVARAWAACASEMPIPPLFTEDTTDDDGTVTLTREEYRVLHTLAVLKLVEDRAHNLSLGREAQPFRVDSSLVNHLAGWQVEVVCPKDSEGGPWLVKLSDNVE